MGKHTKVAPPKPRAERPKERPPLNDRIDDMLHVELDHLETLRTAVEATLAKGDAPPALVRESAGVSRAIAQLSAEARAREKHTKERATAMTPEEHDDVLKTHLAAMPADRRQAITAYLIELDGLKTVL